MQAAGKWLDGCKRVRTQAAGKWLDGCKRVCTHTHTHTGTHTSFIGMLLIYKVNCESNI